MLPQKAHVRNDLKEITKSYFRKATQQHHQGEKAQKFQAFD